ncbi:MAG: MlrC C-terminal domain-containing protein, partial [Alphaproteobacteria bacterium]
FIANLTSLDDATQKALHSPVPLAFADVADNPGGGGRGNTMWILEAFHRAGVQHCLVGVIHDPALAAEAHKLGKGARFTARFNRDVAADDPFSKPFSAEAEVVALSDGRVTGRRGIFAGTAMTLGATAALQIGGMTVVVKSRGHFRGGFDEFFKHDQIVEVDCPGLTSPILTRFDWKHMPRPVLPIDKEARWP